MLFHEAESLLFYKKENGRYPSAIGGDSRIENEQYRSLLDHIQAATLQDMSIKQWLKHNFHSQSLNDSKRVDLVGDSALNVQPATPNNAGLKIDQPPQPWSISKINSILIDARTQPSTATFLAARQARYQLSLFWITAPVDIIEELYQSKLGSLQRAVLEHPLLSSNLASDEKTWRKILLNRRKDPRYTSQIINQSLALMIYRKPGAFKLKDAPSIFPQSILEDYIYYCDKSLRSKLNRKAGLLGPAE